MNLIQINELAGALNFLSIKELNVEEIKNAIKLKKKLKSLQDEIKELQLEVMKKHNVEEKNGRFQFEIGSETAKDIDLVNTDNYEVSPLNFLPFEKIKSNFADNNGIPSDSLALLEVLIDNLATN